MADQPETSKSGGTNERGSALKVWAPVLLTIAVLPLVVYLMTSLILVPHLKAMAPAQEKAAAEKGGADGERTAGQPPSPVLTYKARFDAMEARLQTGSMVIVSQFTVAGDSDQFENKIRRHRNELMETAQMILSSRTMNDMEQPEGRDKLRIDLMDGFNQLLGTNIVKGLYFGELAIQ